MQSCEMKIGKQAKAEHLLSLLYCDILTLIK